MALVSLTGEREFRKVRKHGVVIRGPLFTLRITEYRPRYGAPWQPRAIIGLVVPKKTLKRAVDRNRSRRRVRAALQTLPQGLPACRAILMINAGAMTVPFTELQTALAKAFAKAFTKVPPKGTNKARKTSEIGANTIASTSTTNHISQQLPNLISPPAENS